MNDELRDHFKKHVEDHSYDIDPQEIWDGILVKESRRRRRPFLWLLPLVGLVAILWVTFSYNNDTVMESTTPEELLVSSEDTSTEAAISDDATNNRTTNALDNRQAENSANTKKNITTQTETETIDDTENDQPQELKSFPATSQFNLFSTSPTSSQLALQAMESSNALPANEASEDVISEQIIEQLPLTKSFSPLSSVTSFLAFDRDRSIDLWPLIIPAEKTRRMTLRMMGGVGKLNNQVSPATPDPDQANAYQTELWRSATSAQLVYSGRVMMDFDIGKGFYLGTGISYEKAIERFRLDGNYIVDADGKLVTETIFDSEGNTAVNFNSESNTEEYYVSVDRNIDSYNGYEYVDIPFQLGYAMSFSRWTPSLYMGASLNVASRNTGYLYGSDGLPITFAETGDPIQLGLRYYGGIEMDYQLCRRFVLTLGLEYSSRRREQHGTISNYQVMGTNLGIGYQF